MEQSPKRKTPGGDAQQADDEPSTSGRGSGPDDAQRKRKGQPAADSEAVGEDATEAPLDQQAGEEGEARGGKKRGRKEGGDAGMAAAPPGKKARVLGGNAFTTEQLFTEKKLKDRKKEFLKRKAEKQKGGRKAGAGRAPVVEKELQLRDQVKFGEVVHAPLDVQLKRKHW
jgi:hypothetical protein